MIWTSFNKYREKVNWTLFTFICLFTMGSWIDISGIWCELPIMVNSLPEGWRLPAILTVTSQLAQLGPFLFFTGRLILPHRFGNVTAIYFIFSIGAISCLLLSAYWDQTVVLWNEKRSIYLYIFNFTLSLLDGMSTITFLPYIGEHFIKEYIIANYVGESLSSLVPGLLGIFQGVSSASQTCNTNETTLNNQTSLIDQHQQSAARFSVSLYFFFMFTLVCLSALSFTFINFWSRMRINRKVVDQPANKVVDVTEFVPRTSTDASTSNTNCKTNADSVVISALSREKYEMGFLFCLTFIVSFVYYGYLPGIFSYSTIPYGIKYFHLATNISCICLPFSILLSIWSYEVSLRRIVAETALPLLASCYILATAAMSPCPPLIAWATQAGGYLAVASWVLTSCAFMRVRCLIATKLERHGKNALFAVGCFTILGQCLGGLAIFAQVEIYRLFRDAPKCEQISCPL